MNEFRLPTKDANSVIGEFGGDLNTQINRVDMFFT